MKRARKTYRVREQDNIVVANELVEFDFSLGGDSSEVRGSRAETETISTPFVSSSTLEEFSEKHTVRELRQPF